MAVQGPLPPFRRRRHRRLAHALRIGALTAAFLAGLPPTGQAAAATRVILHLPTGERTFDEQQLSDYDVVSEDYVLRSPSSEEHETLSGISVQRLLEEAGYAPQDGFLRLARADGTWATLGAADVRDPSPFQGGLKPIVFLDSVRVRYFRPVRDGADVNGRDNLATEPGQPLEIWVQTGVPLTVTARASPAKVDAREKVTFTASVAGARGGVQVSVRWRFDDGTTARGASVRHAFAAEGTYGAVATAEGEQGSGGASEPVRVEVGPPAKKAHGPGTGTGTKSEGPQTGPRKSRGAHQREGTPAPAATSTPGPVATGTPGPVATSTPVPAATPAPRAAAPRQPKRRRHPAPAPGGEVVRGALVSSSAPLPFPKTVAAPAAAERVAARAGDASAGGVTVAILAVLLLFGAGAWSERRKERW